MLPRCCREMVPTYQKGMRTCRASRLLATGMLGCFMHVLMLLPGPAWHELHSTHRTQERYRYRWPLAWRRNVRVLIALLRSSIEACRSSNT